MREYFIDTKTMELGYMDEDMFIPIGIFQSTGDCGFAMQFINIELFI